MTADLLPSASTMTDQMDTSDDLPNQTPFLVPCFVRPAAFHPLALFEDRRPPHEDEWSLHAWEDSTLADLTKTLLACLPRKLTSPQARFAYRMVWFDGHVTGGYKQKDLDTVALKDLKSRDVDLSGFKTLRDLLFTPGTYLLVAIHNIPAPHGSAAVTPAAAGLPGAPHAAPAAGGVWRSTAPLPPMNGPADRGGAPEGSWTRGGFGGGRGGRGRGGFAGRDGGFENGLRGGRGGFGGPGRGGFGERDDFRGGGARGGWGASDRGGFAARGGGGFSNGSHRDGWGAKPSGDFSNGARDVGGWAARRGGASRSPSPPPQRRRDASPEPVNFRGGRRPSPTY